MNKKVIIIISIIAIVIVVTCTFLFFRLNHKNNNSLDSKVKIGDIKDTTSTLTVQGDYDLIPYSEKAVTDDGETTTEEEQQKDKQTISANPSGIPLDPENPTVPTIATATPEENGALNPILEYKPLEVEQAETSENVVLNVVRPTFILFIDLSNNDSIKMLNLVNNLSMSYSDKVDFVLISNSNAERYHTTDYLENNGIKLPLFFDNGEPESPIAQYGITSLPHTLIIDKYGNIINSISGAKERDTITANLDIISENYD